MDFRPRLYSHSPFCCFAAGASRKRSPCSEQLLWMVLFPVTARRRPAQILPPTTIPTSAGPNRKKFPARPLVHKTQIDAKMLLFLVNMSSLRPFLPRVCDLDQSSVFQPQGPPAPYRQVHVVRYQNRRQSVTAVQALNQVKNPAGCLVIQVASWLVGQQQPRAANQRWCQSNTYELSTRT